MLTPEYLLHVTEGAEEIAEELHNDILARIIERIVIRFNRGDKYILTATDKWKIEVLQEAGYLLDGIQKEIAKKTPYMEKEIAQAMEDAGVRAIAYDNAIYEAVGLPAVDVTKSPYMTRLLQRNYEATAGEFHNFTRTMAEAAQQTYVKAVDKAYMQVMSGAVSSSQAVKESVNAIAKDGVKVQYPSGHTDTIETATARAVRTGISQGSAQIQLARMKEDGDSLVVTSSHMGARPTHDVWQGKVFSINWDKLAQVYPLPDIPTPQSDAKMMAKYPDFVDSTRIGQVDGLCGANCRHSFSVFFEGMANPFEQYGTEENKKAYDLQQRQRAMERRIRKTKREAMALNTARENATGESKEAFEQQYQKKAALLSQQNAEYNKFCKETGLKRQSERLQIAKWDRSQAAKARAAAQKYEQREGTAK